MLKKCVDTSSAIYNLSLQLCNDRLAVGMNSKESIYFKYNFKISGYVQNATAYLHVQNLIFVNLNIAFRLIRKITFLDLWNNELYWTELQISWQIMTNSARLSEVQWLFVL